MQQLTCSKASTAHNAPSVLLACFIHTLYSRLLLLLVQLSLLILGRIHLLVLCQQPPQLTLCIFNPAQRVDL